MTVAGFTLFETPIGVCAVVWGAGGLEGVLLPERDVATTRARVLRRSPDAAETSPPPAIAQAVAAIAALLSGEKRDLNDVKIALDHTPDFERRVYEACRAIPPGSVATYGELAARIGEPGAARAVGVALGRNPWPLVVPCHRVLAAGGRLHGFSAPGGLATKRRLLEIENARMGDEPDLFAPH